MTIHINLLSAQLIPNVIPVLSDVDSVNKVYLVLAGNQFKNKAETLSDFYKDKGIQEIEIFQCEDPNDYYSLRYKAKELFENIKIFYPNETILLNATGGTKPMALAFTLAFDNSDQNSMPIYTDTFKKRVVILNDNESLKPLPYDDVLNISDYFRLNDFELTSENSDLYEKEKSRADITKKISAIATHDPVVISIMNALAQESNFNRPESFIAEVGMKTKPKGKFKELLNHAQTAGLLTFSDKYVTFSSLLAARYFGGAWLEELIYLAALDAGITKLELNVSGQIHQKNAHDHSVVENEFDAVMMSNNQMMVVEAKTINWQKQEGKGQEAAVKLDSLTQSYGGSFAKGCLVSLFPFTERIQKRFEHIPSLSCYQLQSFDDLVEYFAKWKESTLA